MTDIKIEDLTSDQIVTNKRRIGRLVELRRVIRDEVPKVLNGHKFDMRSWIVSAESTNPYVDGSGERFEPISCHTSACACGWGGLLSDRLKKAGLKWDNNTSATGLSVEGGTVSAIKLSEFFGVHRAVANYLFYPGQDSHTLYDANGMFGGYIRFDSYGNRVGEQARLEFLSRVDMILNKAGG